MRSISFNEKTWDGHRERRTRPRRAEDLKKCICCDVFFSWKSCGQICSGCGHKLIALNQGKGKILNIFT